MSEATRTVRTHGLTFGALTWGAVDGDAPLALLLHGYPDTAWTWRHLGPRLADAGFRVVAPFLRGYGPTDLAPDDRYDARTLVADVVALHQTLRGDDRAVLVGHDWGAVVAWGVSAWEPGRFARIACLSVPPPPALLRPWTRRSTVGVGIRQLRMSWYMAFQQLPVERTLPRLMPRLWRDWSPRLDGGEDAARALAALDTPARRRAALRYYRNNLQSGAKDGFTLKPVQPALYLHGDADGCMQAEIGALYDADLPAGSEREVLDGLGHFLHLEDPGLVGGRIVDWVS